MRKRILLSVFLLPPAILLWPVAAPSSAQRQNKPTPTAPVTEVSIERVAFFRPAPIYQALFRRNGTATYIGESGVDKIGTFTAQISGFDRLAQAVQQRGFQNLKDEYDPTPNATDLPATITSVVSGGHRKTVSNHAEAGPQALEEIQTLIDQKVAAAHWKKVSSTKFR